MIPILCENSAHILSSAFLSVSVPQLHAQENSPLGPSIPQNHTIKSSAVLPQNLCPLCFFFSEQIWTVTVEFCSSNCGFF